MATRSSTNKLRAAGLIIATYMALALAYSVIIPPFEGLDEVEHFGVVRYVAERGRLPVQAQAGLEDYHVRQEASQPSLYYLLAGPLLRLSRISTHDVQAYLVANPYVTCGTEAVRSNKAVLRHEPLGEAFPWRDTLLALHLLRALSIVLQAFTVAGVYAIARRAFPHRRGVPELATALTAFNPQFLIVASSVNNDNVATPVITWAVYVILLVVQEGLSSRRALLLGGLIGLAAISKLTGLLLVPLAAISIFNFQFSIFKIQLSTVKNAAVAGGIMLLVAGWWYLRNWQLYGDPTGLAPMLDIVGRRGAIAPGLLLSELGLVFRSYWGQFPCAFFDSSPYYAAWALVVGLGFVGVAWGLRREDRPTRLRAVYLAAWLGFVLIGWLRWNMTTPAPGGRLLFSAVGAASTLLAYGLAWRWPRLGYGGALAAACVGLLALLVWVRPLFAPPPLVDATRIKPQHALQAQFGPAIGLLGYDLESESLGPGSYLDITLYWRALQPIAADYTLALQLAALAPGDTRTLLNFNTWPGGGNLPTSAWPLGPVSVDRYRLPLPADTGFTQAWRVQAIVYHAQDGTRLPLSLDGQPAGDTLTLGTRRVAGTSLPTLPKDARLVRPATFDQSIALSHAQVSEQADGIHVSLLWQSLKPLPTNATIFVHAYDLGGALVATGDGPPMGGSFPVSLWQSGDRVLDEHVLVLPATHSLDAVQIKVGLYRPEDGLRLAAISEQGEPWPDNAVLVWDTGDK
ncbi:MAG: glycosyltransferase family 39 protein [Thermoflexales bacterium]|nr:glycosyltransferase family 39 protein [Thermoflexales bacterium]